MHMQVIQSKSAQFKGTQQGHMLAESSVIVV
jgi:hypothetical protein